jgi:hypothetical protein
LKPTYPITINGNKLDESRHNTTKSPVSRYILVQSRVPFNQNDMTKLEEAGAEYLDYVSENTYLCRYQKSMEDQIPISKLEFVVYCADFGDEFKISPGLKEARDEAPDKSMRLTSPYIKVWTWS